MLPPTLRASYHRFVTVRSIELFNVGLFVASGALSTQNTQRHGRFILVWASKSYVQQQVIFMLGMLNREFLQWRNRERGVGEALCYSRKSLVSVDHLVALSFDLY